MGYFAAVSADEALAILAGGDVSIVAGCTDWYPSLGEAKPSENILDITRVPDFCGITRLPQEWRIGATTRWTDIINADLPKLFGGLKEAAREVGSVQIQNSATIAGNICNASPAADGIPPLLTLNCSVEIISQTGKRRLPLADFVTGVRKTALNRGEILSAIFVPDVAGSVGGSFQKLGARKYLVISIAMVSALIGIDEKQRIHTARIAVGSCSPVAQRMSNLESALIGLGVERLAGFDFAQPDMLTGLSAIDDSRASAEFRIGVLANLCRQAVITAASKAI